MSVARSYARAIYEAATEAKATTPDLDNIELQLRGAVQMMKESKGLQVALLSPATSAKDKQAVIGEISKKAGHTPLVRNFLALMARKGRLSILADVHEAFGIVRLEAEGGTLGRLVSADPMNAEDVAGLAKAFTQKLGKRVAFSASTDPSLLAGVKVTVNGVTFDGTLRSQLQRLRDELVYGTSATH